MILYTERDVHGTGGFKDGGEGRGPRSQARRFWYPKGAPSLRRKNKKLKRIFFFKEKKETRRKGINVSQLAIRNSNDITEKHEYTLYYCFFFFFFTWFFLKAKTFKHIFAENEHFFLLFSLKKYTFFLY